MDTLYWGVVAGEVDQQIEVPTTSVATVRMVARPAPLTFFTSLESVDLSARNIEVIPASAPSGIYIIGFSVNCRTPQSAGTYGSNVTFNTPRGQASSLGWGNVQVTSAGIFSAGTTSTMPRVIAFGRGTACTLTLTPTGVTGSPVYDFYTTAQLVEPL